MTQSFKNLPHYMIERQSPSLDKITNYHNTLKILTLKCSLQSHYLISYHQFRQGLTELNFRIAIDLDQFRLDPVSSVDLFLKKKHSRNSQPNFMNRKGWKIISNITSTHNLPSKFSCKLWLPDAKTKTTEVSTKSPLLQGTNNFAIPTTLVSICLPH